MQKDEEEEVIKSDSRFQLGQLSRRKSPQKIKQKGTRKKKSLVRMWLDYLQGIFWSSGEKRVLLIEFGIIWKLKLLESHGFPGRLYRETREYSQ